MTKPMHTAFVTLAAALGAALTTPAFAKEAPAPAPTLNLARPSTPAEAEAGRNNPDITSFSKTDTGSSSTVPEAKPTRRIVVDMNAAGAKFDPNP